MIQVISDDKRKDTQKQVFIKRLKIKQKPVKIGADFKMNFDSRLGELFSK